MKTDGSAAALVPPERVPGVVDRLRPQANLGLGILRRVGVVAPCVFAAGGGGADSPSAITAADLFADILWTNHSLR